MPPPDQHTRPVERGTLQEVLTAFLRLGLTSFGGPVAHIGYFRLEFVERRRWLSESRFAQVLAICQFLPGPASSQLGFCIGLLRAGWPGAVAAFLAFTLPSVIALTAFAAVLPRLSGPLAHAAVHGLKLVALVFVAQAVAAMTRQLCPDTPRRMVAVASAATILLAGMAQVQLMVIAIGAVAGLLFLRPTGTPSVEADFGLSYGTRTAVVLVLSFAVMMLAALFMASSRIDAIGVFNAFFRAGGLVFGGGHVVLPLLEETVVAPGWVPEELFLSGYGAAQALPGPLFSIAAYLGMNIPGNSGGITGAGIALLGIFLPGFLLVSAALPIWRRVSARPAAARAIAGVNAAVVGLLAAALYDPVFISAVRGGADLAIGVVGILLLAAWRARQLIVIGWCVVASTIAGITGLA